LKKWHFLRFG